MPDVADGSDQLPPWLMGSLAAQDNYTPPAPLPIGNPMGEAAPAPPVQGQPYNPVGDVARGLVQQVTTPGSLMQPNPYPAGSEQADWYDANRASQMVPWAGNMALATMGSAAAAPAKAGEVVLGAGPIRAYHSSPYDFNAFDASKIGTGEGAQSYGHGLYFSENPKVSGQYGDYWKAFAQRFIGNNDAEGMATLALRNTGGDRQKAIDFLKAGQWQENYPKQWADAIPLLESGKPVGPRTYEVNINADPAQMLDWDKPLAQQPKTAQDFAARRGLASWDLTKGADIYNSMGLNSERASQALREAGIPGIKYLDQGSRGVQLLSPQETVHGQWLVKQIPNGNVFYRGADEAAAREAYAKGLSSNYVVFDPSIIQIMRKYGLAGAVPAAGAMGGLAAHDNYQPGD